MLEELKEKVFHANLELATICQNMSYIRYIEK